MNLEISYKLRKPICKGIWEIENWFLMESDSWTGKIALLLFVYTKEG